MALKVVGAGLGRTGTHSLKIGLEQLLKEPCYHMSEVFRHPEHIPTWHAAANGEPVDWEALLTGYAAAVDWPASAFWPELSNAYPEAVVILSVREPQSWWNSSHETIFTAMQAKMSGMTPEWYAMMMAILGTRFTAQIDDREACIAAFVRHNDEVRRMVSPDRLVVWKPQDGWAPLCKALGVSIPEGPFPISNTKEEFLARLAPH